MRLLSCCFVLSVVLFSLVSGGIVAAEDAPAAEAYVPAADNQLMCLGDTKSPRFTVTEISWPEKPGDAEVCLWKDDKYAAASITIDDNCAPDHKWWLEQCRKNDIKVTWFVVTGGVGGKNKGFNGTWDGFAELVKAGNCVGSHSVTHGGSDDKKPDEHVIKEYAVSKKAAEDGLSAAGVEGYRCLVLAYPCGRGKPEIAEKYYIAVRGVNGMPNAANRINYSNTRKGGISQEQIDAVLGKPIKNPKLQWLGNKEFKRGWIAPLYHYVPHGKTKEEKVASRARAEKELANLASYKDTIWIDTFEAVVKYGQERDSATLKTVSVDDQRIELSLTDKMRGDIFTFPLTLKVCLPDDWVNMSAVQGDAAIESVVIKNAGKAYALVQAVPDKGNIVLQRK